MINTSKHNINDPTRVIWVKGFDVNMANEAVLGDYF